MPLASDLMPTGNDQPTQLLSDDAPWQSGIIEGPDMVETPTTTGNTTTYNYTLFYSGSDEGASTYAIGWASCPSGPAAACTDMSTTAPLLTTSPGMSGPGGPDVYSPARSGHLRSSSWPSRPGRASPSAISPAASAPCTWPT